MSSPDAKTPDELNASFDDAESKEAKGSLASLKTLEETDKSNIPLSENEEEGEEEEQGECGFCLFMKGGGCKEGFIAWEDCIKEAEKNQEDIVEKCFEVTSALKLCMEAHADYYAPILKAEKAAEEEAVRELEKENEQEKEAAAASAKEAESNEKEK